MNRRNFAQTIAAGLAASACPELRAATPRNLKIGHTCLTWNSAPRTPENLEEAVKDISELGYWCWETFADVLDSWDSKGTLAPLMEKYKVPLRSGYFTTNVIDPTQRKETLDKVARLARVIKKYSGTFMVLAANGVKRDGYSFAEHKQNVVDALNEYAKAAVDAGISTGFHQHTGTAVESRDEVYALMDSVDTKYLKFAPDVGQLQKGGADAAKVIKDFAPITVHMHLKDWVGSDVANQYYAGYCPLGRGQVDLVSVLDTMERSGHPANIMVELDRSAKAPMSARETATITKAYLEKLGYTFRT
ncbi:MAG TPA: sugar phosphate isomerase/epimerase [Bryobacteraceae bacterium]|nr:sugar phosphate isomerase/epimerase [Bryobacteraceae bacterium]